jgi:hypothetical protein
MIHGLLWFPLLAIFIGLAWAGRNEYQKLQVYRVWAEPFDRAKYDIYSVLGQKEANITWGQPSRKGIFNLQTFSFQQVQAIDLWADGQTVDLAHPPTKSRKVALEFRLLNAEQPIQIPFTDLALAVQWGRCLEQEWQRFQRKSP